MSLSEPVWCVRGPSLSRAAPAKLNLTLAVKGKRADGFHELESWVVPVGLFDEITIVPASEYSLLVDDDVGWEEGGFAGADSVPQPWKGRGTQLSADESNLVSRAVMAMAEAAAVSPHVGVRLTKRIPIGAGLGGGSSDAAATLLMLNEAWGLGWPLAQLAEVGARLGSDVSLFLHRRQLVMRGRGEIVKPLEREFGGWAVLVCPEWPVSTAAVYGAFEKSSASAEGLRPWEAEALGCGKLMPQLFNDLERTAFAMEPRLGELHTRIDGLGGRCVRMTGSGSALFTLFDDEDGARGWGREVAEVGAAARVGVFALLRK